MVKRDAYVDMAEAEIIEDEDLRLKLYRCPAGKWTIGIGRNIEDNGISKQEALFLFRNDIGRSIQELWLHVSCFRVLSDVRRAALLNMMFQLGLPGFLSFKKMRVYLDLGDYDNAAREMLNSKWAGQTPQRATRLAGMMKNG